MAGVLISGPAGGGKTAASREMLAERLEPAVVIDFQAIYATLLGIERLANGRYPEREPRHDYALAMTEYLRRVAISNARENEVYAIVTNSDSDLRRREFLLTEIGDAEEIIFDPGIAVVRQRLSAPDGTLSTSCTQAIRRWFKS